MSPSADERLVSCSPRGLGTDMSQWVEGERGQVARDVGAMGGPRHQP